MRSLSATTPPQQDGESTVRAARKRDRNAIYARLRKRRVYIDISAIDSAHRAEWSRDNYRRDVSVHRIPTHRDIISRYYSIQHTARHYRASSRVRWCEIIINKCARLGRACALHYVCYAPSAIRTHALFGVITFVIFALHGGNLIPDIKKFLLILHSELPSLFCQAWQIADNLTAGWDSYKSFANYWIIINEISYFFFSIWLSLDTLGRSQFLFNVIARGIVYLAHVCISPSARVHGRGCVTYE